MEWAGGGSIVRRLGVGIAGFVAASTLACAWVELTPEAEAVRLAGSEEEVAGCRKVSVIKTQTKARVGFFARSEEKVASELAALARNDAAEGGADTVVAEGPPSVDGRQRFGAYRCR